MYFLHLTGHSVNLLVKGSSQIHNCISALSTMKPKTRLQCSSDINRAKTDIGDDSQLINLEESDADVSKLLDLDPKSQIHCVKNCPSGGVDGPNMICCCMCNKWFHIPCINESGTEPVQNIWNCSDCRTVSSMIKVLQNELYLMRQSMADVVRQNNEILHKVEEVKSENAILKNIIEKLEPCKTSIVADCMDNNNKSNCSKLKEEPKKTMILSRRNQDKPVIEPARPLTESSHNLPDTSRILLLGDSSVTDVRASNQLLKISSDEKNDLFNVYSKLSNMSNDSAKSVVLSIGMNDCLSSKTVSQINKDYEILLNEASRVSQEQVKVSSVCLRSELPGIQSKVNQVNLDLSKLCDSMNCVFVDHSLNFFFRDGSVDYSLYCSNESKLSQKGSARHMLNLGLSEMTKVRTYVPSDDAKKTYTAAVTQDHSRPEQKRRFYRHLANQNSQRHPTERKVPRCWNCGERGHLQDTCRHSQPISCATCGMKGHKSKHCAFI